MMMRRSVFLAGVLGLLIRSNSAMAESRGNAMPADIHRAIAAKLGDQSFKTIKFYIRGHYQSFASATLKTRGRVCDIYLSRIIPSARTKWKYGPWQVNWFSCVQRKD